MKIRIIDASTSKPQNFIEMMADEAFTTLFHPNCEEIGALRFVRAEKLTAEDFDCEKMMIFFPIYHGFPYYTLIKALQEKLVEGVGYKFDENLQKNVGALKIKEVHLIMSVGKPTAPDFYTAGLKELFTYCGVEKVEVHTLGNVKPGMSKIEYDNHIKTVQNIARNLK